MAVVHATGVALVPAMVKAIAQTGGRPFVHVYAFWDDVGRVVFNGQGTQAGEANHAGQGTVLVQRLRRGVKLQIVRNLLRGQPQATWVSHTQRLAATHNGDGLEALVAHDGAAAVLAGHVPVVTVDGGKAYLVFASDAAGVNAELVACQVERLLQGLLRLPGIFAKERT